MSKASAPAPNKEGIRIGTLVKSNNTASYIKQILPHGFESFSITFWASADPDRIDPLVDEVNEALDGSDAVISSLSLFGNLLAGDDDAATAIKGWELLIDNAHRFGCDLVTGFTGRVPDKPIDECIATFKDVWTPLAKRAADNGVRLAFENCDMGGSWTSGDWNIAHNPTAWEMMFNEIPSENVGLQWEPCHQMVSLIDPIPQLRKWVDKVFNVHGKDATVDWSIVREHGVHGPHKFAWHRTPGFGDSNWTDIISILRMAGYQGSIDIEGWHDPAYRADLEMTGQVHALNYLRQCRGGSYVPNPS